MEDEETYGLYPVQPHWTDKLFAWMGIGVVAFFAYLMIVWFNAIE